jgi:hypothetical protein
MNTYNIDVPLCTNVSKTYSYEILNKFNSEYSGPIEWIPFWFYTQYDPNADNAHFVIHGDFHSTYPNEPHLSMNIILPDGSETGMLHVSQENHANKPNVSIANISIANISIPRIKKLNVSISNISIASISIVN